jgi:hypothetical protein
LSLQDCPVGLKSDSESTPKFQQTLKRRLITYE